MSSRPIPLLCAFIGGETGAVLKPLLEALPGELRLVRTATSNGCLIVDRRQGERRVVAARWSDPVSRHEIDDLVSIACAEALGSEALAVCGGYPAEVVPDTVYGELVATARANGIPSFVDLSSPSLDGALEAGPDVVKINDWQLAEWLSAPVDGARWRPAAERLLAAGARAAVVTRAGEPALAVRDGQAWELVPPRLERGFREGCGDSMLGAMAAATAAGESWERLARRRRSGGRRVLPSPGAWKREARGDRRARRTCGAPPARLGRPGHEHRARRAMRHALADAAESARAAEAAAADRHERDAL